APVAAVADDVTTPTISFSGPTRARAKQAITFRLVLPAAKGAANKRVVRYAIDWNGDGRTDETVTGRPGDVLRIRHTYKKTGVYSPKVHVVNAAGIRQALAAATTTPFHIRIVV